MDSADDTLTPYAHSIPLVVISVLSNGGKEWPRLKRRRYELCSERLLMRFGYCRDRLSIVSPTGCCW